MELLDFANPQDAGDLVRQAAGEMDLTAHGDLPRICEEFADMLRTCQAAPLWAPLAAAEKRFAELDFILDAGPVSLRGQIDLIYQDDGGAWHIVDYKSDRLGDEEDVAEHATRYELQMLTYALAAGRHLGCDPADAQLYFLRTGCTHTLAISPDAIRSASERIEGLAKELILARRSGRFERRWSRACETCPYGKLCETAVMAE
jgi:RecB family exonuclease